jgi:predicted phosphodiesterase
MPPMMTDARCSSYAATLDPIPQVARMPEGDASSFSPLTITGAEGRAFVLSDKHVPYHDRDFLEYIVGQAKKQGARWLIDLGDAHDFHRLNRFKKYKTSRSTTYELAVGKDFWRYAREVLGPQCEFLAIPGNHDIRYNDYVIANIPELKELDQFSYESVTGWSDHGVKWASSGMGISINGLLLQHGHENESKFSCASKNPAAKLLDRSLCDTIIGHVHSTDRAFRRCADGREIECYTVGCTSTLSPEYAKHSHWSHGFAVVEFFKRGGYLVNNLRRHGSVMV